MKEVGSDQLLGVVPLRSLLSNGHPGIWLIIAEKLFTWS